MYIFIFLILKNMQQLPNMEQLGNKL